MLPPSQTDWGSWKPRGMGDREQQVAQKQGVDTSTAAANPPQDGRRDVAHGTWLSVRLLLVVDAPSSDPGDTRASVVAGDDSFEAEVRCISLASANGPGRRSILTAALCDDSGTAYGARPLRIVTKPATGETHSADVVLTDLTGILDGRLSGLPPGSASRALEFISAAPTAHGLGQERDLLLSSRLHALRSALRQRLPTVTIERDQPLTGNVDELVAIDESSFFVKGWMRDGEAKIDRFTAVTPEGEYVELLGRLSRYELPEFEIFAGGPYSEPVDATWFVGRFETRRPSRIRREWVFEIRNETGRAVEMRALPSVTDVPSARTRILRSVPERVLPDEQLMSDHLLPAIDRLQEQSRSSIKVESIMDFGDVSGSPEVSIVVPLYKRIDLMEHQLLQFKRDPGIRTAELIYVLDSPELHTALAEQAHQLARLYQVPFRTVSMADNVGFGAATNSGVSVARSGLILLLNSDVLPAEPGWLGTMRAFYEATPDIGALGPKLLYEDDSLRHAGLLLRAAARRSDRGLMGEQALLQGPAQGPAGREYRPPGAGRDCGLPVDREGPLPSKRADCPTSTCRATTRIRSCACGCSRRGARTGTCQRWSCTTWKALPTRLRSAASPGPTIGGSRPTALGTPSRARWHGIRGSGELPRGAISCR